MAMALFRAVENRRTVVRATNGGITCLIDPNGRIPAMIPPFVEAILVAEVPVYAGRPPCTPRGGIGSAGGRGDRRDGGPCRWGSSCGALVKRTRLSLDET